ncbi:hypothetical protein JTF08_00370 [Micrococcaceae bacterium RIT802]|nr:hypothetical protein [Micrococcaceae bacterium RIT 802]
MATSSADPSGTAPALAGPFTLREVVVMAGAVLLLVGSVLPFQVGGGSYANVWTFHTTAFNQFVTLALPLVIGAAFAWRRLSGRTKVTAGSLTLDQLASVVSLLGILYFFISSVMSMNPAFLLGLLGSLVMAGGTTAAPYIPGFVLDFAPGKAALLTRPIRPSAPREPGAGASTPARPHTHTPERTPAAPGQPGTAGQTVAPTVATGLAATHSTTPEPTPGSWPRPGATEEPAFDPALADPQERPGSGEPSASGDGTAATQTAPGTGAPAADPDHAPEGAAAAGGAPSADDAPAAGGTATDDTTLPATTAGPVVDGAPAAPGETAARPSNQAAENAPEAPDPEAPDPEELSFTATSAGHDGPAQQAFWFAVPDRRTALNEATGRNAFVLEPGEWILALEDRGYEFLVQDADGSVGVLRDLGRIERA